MSVHPILGWALIGLAVAGALLLWLLVAAAAAAVWVREADADERGGQP